MQKSHVCQGSLGIPAPEVSNTQDYRGAVSVLGCVLIRVRLFVTPWSPPGSSVHEISQARQEA